MRPLRVFRMQKANESSDRDEVKEELRQPIKNRVPEEKGGYRRENRSEERFENSIASRVALHRFVV